MAFGRAPNHGLRDGAFKARRSGVAYGEASQARTGQRQARTRLKYWLGQRLRGLVACRGGFVTGFACAPGSALGLCNSVAKSPTRALNFEALNKGLQGPGQRFLRHVFDVSDVSDVIVVILTAASPAQKQNLQISG